MDTAPGPTGIVTENELARNVEVNEKPAFTAAPGNSTSRRPSQRSKNSTDTPSGEAKQQPEQKAGFGDFVRIFHYADRLSCLLYAAGFTGAIVVGAALPLMTLVFGSSTSTFNSYNIDPAAAQSFQSNVNHLVLYFVYLFIARFVIGYVSTLCICIAAARTTNALRKAFFESLLRKEIAHFDAQGNGSPATQVTTNTTRINQGIAEKLFTLVMGVSLFFSAYIVALVVQWKLALITMCIIPALFLGTGGCVALVIPIEGRVDRIYSRAAVLAQDAISSIKTIQAFNAQDKIVKWYDEFLQAAHKEGNKKSILFGILFSWQTFLVMADSALAFWEGYRLYQSGEIPNVGTVFTVVLSVTLGATSVLLILPQTWAITGASSAAAELFTVIDKPSQLDPLASEGRQGECNGQIEIRNLCFSYPSRDVQVLHDFSITLPAGKTTALVGPSGCGKSTLVGLLERWYNPTSGQILLDGIDISEYNVKWLRSNIRPVQQEPTLFQGTIFDNVTKGLVQNVSEEKQMELVRDACIAADAHDFIERLPGGYHTELSESGRNLSGGQRQRLSIARSIISDPKILLFDEATSALDPRAERVVQDALNRVSKDKTTLVIAHKLATIKAADNIAVMNNGRIVEQGTHAQLLQQDGLYAAMVRAQDLGSASEEQSEQQPDVLDHTVSLLQTKSNVPKEEKLTTGTVNYSLLRCVLTMLGEHKDLYPWYIFSAAVYLVLSGTYPAQALLFSRLINVFTLQGSEGQSQANFYALMFFIVALVNLLGYFFIGISTNTLGQILTHRYRKEMIQRMINFDQDFFDANSSGALTSKLSSAPTAVQELMSQNVGLIVNVSGNVFASSILAIAYGWKLGLTLVFGGLTVIVGSGYVRIRLDQKLEASRDEQFTDSAGLAAEAVSAIRTVNLLTLETDVVRRYSQMLDAIVGSVVKSLMFTLIPYAFSQSADFLVMALGFWYGSRLVAEGEYSVEQFFVIFIAIVFGGQGAAQFFQYTTSITKATGSANYIFWLRTVKPTISETDINQGRGPIETALALEDVEFAYKTTKVLRGLSLTIKPGTHAAVVGPSGCGKSTIVSLLERFYDPTSGRIILGEDISTMSPRLYRQYMSLVQQEPPLYMGSVRENVTIGLDHEVDDEEVMQACKQANAHDFVSSLPEGLSTPCGNKGLQFSGGQRQRIALARALIRKPRLLLLDEATSALDTQSERIVQKAIDEAASSRTTIAVAHRLSTIRHADVIFVIEDGKIAEMGTHAELQAMQGRYHAMCLAQSLDR